MKLARSKLSEQILLIMSLESTARRAMPESDKPFIRIYVTFILESALNPMCGASLRTSCTKKLL